MENRNTCPICNKIGIKDFLKEDVVCPCCGSDLSVYRKIDILSEYNNNFHKNESRHRWVIGISLIACSLFIFSTFLFSIYSKVRANTHQLVLEVESLKKEKIELLDSIAKINETKNIYKSAVIESINNEWYIVKKGDSFCKISKQLYGNESNYKEIIQLNNLTESTLLFPGDSLRIK